MIPNLTPAQAKDLGLAATERMLRTAEAFVREITDLPDALVTEIASRTVAQLSARVCLMAALTGVRNVFGIAAEDQAVAATDTTAATTAATATLSDVSDVSGASPIAAGTPAADATNAFDAYERDTRSARAAESDVIGQLSRTLAGRIGAAAYPKMPDLPA